jgi:hypothetical protein
VRMPVAPIRLRLSLSLRSLVRLALQLELEPCSSLRNTTGSGIEACASCANLPVVDTLVTFREGAQVEPSLRLSLGLGVSLRLPVPWTGSHLNSTWNHASV